MCKTIPSSLKEANVINGEGNSHVDISDVCLVLSPMTNSCALLTYPTHRYILLLFTSLFMFFQNLAR